MKAPSAVSQSATFTPLSPRVELVAPTAALISRTCMWWWGIHKTGIRACGDLTPRKRSGIGSSPGGCVLQGGAGREAARRSSLRFDKKQFVNGAPLRLRLAFKFRGGAPGARTLRCPRERGRARKLFLRAPCVLGPVGDRV